jgi:anti-sigma factor RsiW
VDSCKLIARLVSAGLDRDLTAGERLRVRVHLLFCRHCANMERQFRAMRTFMKHLALGTGNASEKDD